ncbi:hypothetical protein PoB_005164400 [Plakobranchus ocellatus]|uniref:Uncharacterized protein n=1 Tax=Plakobranchus ocellatus TaxID=259542 RepID=A0AAV4C376_9GAST|nr:hypothetical protein PoB_005164400 [Plakobranchus ocellatus]
MKTRSPVSAPDKAPKTLLVEEGIRCIFRLSCVVGGVGGTVDSESALRSAGILLSRVLAQPPTPGPTEDLKA